MKYEAGAAKVQYRCNRCGTVSPHDGKCFMCSCTIKTKVVVPEIIPKRNKGQGININIG